MKIFISITIKQGAIHQNARSKRGRRGCVNQSGRPWTALGGRGSAINQTSTNKMLLRFGVRFEVCIGIQHPPPIHRRPDNVRQGRGYLKSQFSLGRLWWITPNCNSINLGPKQIGTSVGNFFHRPYIWTADWHMCRHSFFDEEAVSVSTTSNLIAVIG